MSKDKCQVSCYDAEEDATYSVAMSATAWVNTDQQNSCGLAVYEYTYKDEVSFTESSTLVRYIDPAEEVRNYGGYLYGNEEEKKGETYTYGFDDAFLEQLQLPEYWWKLLFSGYVDVEKSALGKITAMYNHRINPCPLGTYVEIHAMCDGHGTDTDEVGIACTVYKNGEPQDLKTTHTWNGAEVKNTYYEGCVKSDCDAVSVPPSS